MQITTHTASGVSPAIEGDEVRYKCEFIGSGIAQLEVSNDEGATWQGADKPRTGNMPEFVWSSTGNHDTHWRMNVQHASGGAITTHLGAGSVPITYCDSPPAP